MLWSTYIKSKYAECLVRFTDNELSMNFEHLPPLIDNDGGHGMIFADEKSSYFTFHTPNVRGEERPEFCFLEDNGNSLDIKYI